MSLMNWYIKASPRKLWLYVSIITSILTGILRKNNWLTLPPALMWLSYCLFGSLAGWIAVSCIVRRRREKRQIARLLGVRLVNGETLNKQIKCSAERPATFASGRLRLVHFAARELPVGFRERSS